MTDATKDMRDSKATPDENMTKREKDAMANQMEEFEGPERREIRGDECDPPKDPGVSHS
jgi:hypothetical protein